MKTFVSVSCNGHTSLRQKLLKYLQKAFASSFCKGVEKEKGIVIAKFFLLHANTIRIDLLPPCYCRIFTIGSLLLSYIFLKSSTRT